ncbi:MAG: hypothetical protein EAZ85_03750 [Bacteroidetes bacterium]|nr:MAG: hypothetical protein EAZ85_03750 [Bacteroidota bacterium]
MNITTTKLKYIFTFSIFLLSIIIFFLIVRNVRTDIQGHNLILLKQLDNNSFPIPPLYYFCIYILSGLSTNIVVLNYTSVVFLGFLVAWKYNVTTSYIKKKLLDNQYHQSKLLPFLVALVLIFIVPIFINYPNDRMYLGKLGINIWHNSTTICVMPFVILLYRQSIYFLENKEINTTNIFLIFIFISLNVLIKPSFLFCFLPAFILMNLIQEKKIFTKKYIYVVCIVLFSFLLIFIQYYLIYLSSHYEVLYAKDTQKGIIFKPFDFFLRYSRNIPLDIFLSLTFPLFFILFFFKEIKNNVEFQYSFLMLLFALMLGFLFVESGKRMTHGNLTWQIPIANYIFYMVNIILFLQIIIKTSRKHLFQPKFIILYILCAHHFLSGIYYVVKMIMFRTLN